MSGKHTPEPWEYREGAEGYAHVNKGTTSIASFVLPNNAKRIVQCVNACDGIEDPAKYISELKQKADTYELLLASAKAAANHINTMIDTYGGSK